MLDLPLIDAPGVTPDVTGRLDRETGAAEGLPGSFYTARSFTAEQKALFPRSWCAVALGSFVPNPGDIYPVDLAGWPLIILRDSAGEIRAYHNVCRHRGMKFVTGPCHAKVMRCPWHSWAYGLDGRLLATPDLGGANESAAEGFDRSQLGLVPVAVGTWLDLVCVNIAGNAPPFDEYTRPLTDLLDAYDFDDLGHIGGGTYHYDANWKICVEGSIEDYHLPFGHPEINAEELRNSTPILLDDAVFGVMTQVPPPAPGTEDEHRPWAAHLPTLPLKAGGMPDKMYSLSLFPNTGMLVAFDHIAFAIYLPDGHGKTRYDYGLYTVKTAATGEEFAGARQGNLDLWDIVVAQDKPFWEGAQQTAEVRDQAGIQTRFSPYWEVSVHGFQKAVADKLIEGATANR
jgi:choline monooxygenase